MPSEARLAASDVTAAVAEAGSQADSGTAAVTKGSEPPSAAEEGVYAYRKSTPAELKRTYEAAAAKLRSELLRYSAEGQPGVHDRFEVVKMLAVLSKLETADPAYGLPLDQAKQDGLSEVVALLTWLNAPTDPKSSEPEPELSPVVKACLAQVQRTLGAGVGNGSAGGIQDSILRQARATQECHQLAEGRAPGQTLVGVATQEGVMGMAARIAQGGNTAQGRHSCQQLAQRVSQNVAAKGAASVEVYDALEEAKRYNCY